MVDIVISVAAKVGEYLVAPVGRQLGYLFHYNSNITELQDEAKKLGDKRQSLQLRVEEAERKGDEILPDVRNWLTSADDIFQEVEKFIEDEKNAKKSCFFKLCPNLISRHQLSRQAKKKTEDVKKSQRGGDFQAISHRPPPPGAGSAALPGGYEAFDSRNPELEKIMESLRCDDVKMIGVWGMGGVGKTTLVKQVARLAKQENLFATEIYIDVSWTQDSDSKKLEEGIAKIQQHIADMLGFKFMGKGETTRAAELMKRLQQKEKEPEKEKELKKGKILIILDDIWKEINLEEVGIPSKDDQTICKVVSVSRNEHLLSKGMGTEICFRIRHLQEKEDWRLFTKTVGDSVEGNNELRSIAIEVVKECGGLPIAIVTVANALKGECVDVWKNALHELRTSAPTSIYGVEEKVYACLELSYNRLKDDKVKSLFLLCGCLSYYGDISMDVLLARAMGLDFFDDTELLEQARHKLVALVRTLKASSLLLDGEDDGDASRVGTSRLLFMDAEDNKSVRMHDLVRDVARNIASKDPHRFVVREDVPLEKWSETDGSKFISLYCKVVHKLPHKLVCPKLQFFLLQNNSPSLNVPDNFFEGMNQLKVLALSGMHFTTIPSTLQSLANLRTLCLERCTLEDIVVITELKKLQVLSMVGSSIQQLPQEMARLTNLRLLDLNYCRELKVIPRNILSNMSGLECLFMKSSFCRWAAEENNNGESNACLSELNHLHHLTTIEVEIPNVKLVPEEDKFFQNLTSYAIFIGNFKWQEKKYKRSKTLRLQTTDGSLLFRNGMGKLLEKIEELVLVGIEELVLERIAELLFGGLKDNILCNYEKNDSTRSLFSPSMLGSFHNLKYLSIFDYRNVFISNEDEVLFGEKISFPNLEELELNQLPKLKKIWPHQLPLNSFSNLGILRVVDCPLGPNLIPSHLMQSFKNLKKIEVEDCPVLEHVFDLGGYDTNGETLPKLEILKLENLYELKGIICNNGKNDSISSFMSMSFHNLKYLSIQGCGKEDKDQENVNISVEDAVLFSKEVSFPNLEEVTLEYFPKLKKIWHDNLSLDSFSNLRILRVTNCPCLLNLIPSPSSFKNLKKIEVWMCEALENLAINTPIEDGVHLHEEVSLPNLEEVTLDDLPQLKTIWDHNLSPHSFSNLRILTVKDCPCQLNVIPAHLMGSLNNLKEMIVRKCEALEHVFDLQGYDDTNVEILPKLETLELEGLVELKGIVANNDSTRGCFSPWMPVSFYNLKCLSIKNCGKEDKDQGNADILIQDGVFFGEKVSFPTLEKVTLYRLPKLKKIWDHNLSPHSFSNLRILKVEYCLCLLNVIPAHLMGSLNNLKEMIVKECKALEHVFDLQGYDDTNVEILPKLETLKLEDLVELKGIVANNDSIRGCFSPWMPVSFYNLKCLSIKNCGKEDKDQGNADILIQDGVFFGEKVSFPNLEELNLSGLSMLKMIWHPQQYEFSDKLQILRVCTCPRLVNLIPSHLLQRFQNLKKLVVRDCEILNYVFDGEGILPNVEILKLEELPKLKLIFNNGDMNDNMTYLLSLSKFKVLEHIKKLHIINCGKSVDEEVPLFEMETLSPDEALTLFKKTGAGGADSVVEENITELIKECEGVPLAIVTIAKALKDETMDVWKNALEHLKNCTAADGKKKVVYSCVEWSYTHLKDDDVKSLLLLCGQLDYGDISIDHLLQYAIGLDLFGTIDSLDQARNRLLELVEILKASSWLIELDHRPDQDRHNFVRMYDVVYDVVREIASKDPRPFVFKEDVVGLEEWSKSDESKRCAFLSLHCKVVPELPQQLVCPELQCFLLRNNNPSLNIPIPKTFFQGMKKLQVLDLSYMDFTTLPSSLNSLENLQTLLLDRCYKLEDIALIGKLTKLQVLSLVGSTIRKLPNEMEQLTNLRLLDLNDCKELKIIPQNVLSCFSRLECLRIRLSDAKLLPKDIQFENLTRYAITIGFWWGSRKTHRTLTLNKVNISLDLGDGIRKLLERSEELEYKELSGTNYVLQYPLGGESLVKLKHLKVSGSPEIEYIIDSKDQRVLEHGAAFPLLESLVLFGIENLQEVWHGHPIPRGSFGNLKTLEVVFCDKLRYLFSFSTAKGLSQLQNMTIRRCGAMEQIIIYERELEDEYDEGGTNLELFPNLQTLKLEYLPKLINFIPELETDARLEDSSFNHKVSFSKLEKLELLEVPKLKDVWNLQRSFGSFSNLRILKVCPNDYFN